MYRSTRTGGVTLDMKMEIVCRDLHTQTFNLNNAVTTIVHNECKRVKSG
jgi:hypothetical protein